MKKFFDFLGAIPLRKPTVVWLICLQTVIFVACVSSGKDIPPRISSLLEWLDMFVFPLYFGSSTLEHMRPVKGSTTSPMGIDKGGV